jgi:hypothetical protein
MWMARVEARMLHREMFEADLRITSGMRPQTPGGSSLHPLGKAIDIGVWHIRQDGTTRFLTHAEQWAFAQQLQERLGEDFDVIIEGPAALDARYRTRQPHIHVEFDPKGRHAQRLVDQ